MTFYYTRQYKQQNKRTRTYYGFYLPHISINGKDTIDPPPPPPPVHHPTPPHWHHPIPPSPVTASRKKRQLTYEKSGAFQKVFIYEVTTA